MELLSKTETKVIEVEWILHHPTQGPLFYKEWLDDSGKCIDCALRSKSGFDLSDDSVLVEEVQEFVDNLDLGK
jgi:hypothetical protein